MDSQLRLLRHKLINVKVPLLERPAEYPKDFFDKSQRKPIVLLPSVSRDGFETICRQTYTMIVKHQLEIDLALAFFCGFLPELQEVLPDNWSSFTINIGQKDQTISPLDLVTVETPQEFVFSQDASQKWTRADNIWMCVVLLAPYILGTNNIYTGDLEKRIESQLIAKGKHISTAVNLDTFQQKYKSWVDNSRYRKVVACVDMFFNKFSLSEGAFLRICTRASRFNGCAAMTSTQYIAKLLNLTVAEFLKWAVITNIANESDKLMSPDQETDNPFSYSAYIMDLGLSSKSPYSAKSNPNIYFFVHAIGCTFLSEKSKNAKMFDEFNVCIVLLYAQWFSIAFMHMSNLAKIHSKTKKCSSSNSDVYRLPGDAEMPSKFDPKEWLVWYYKDRPTREAMMRKITMEQWAKLVNPRRGTVGYYLKNLSRTHN